MSRIAGINLPKEKRIVIALTYIYGIGKSLAIDICKNTNINENKSHEGHLFLKRENAFVAFFCHRLKWEE